MRSKERYYPYLLIAIAFLMIFNYARISYDFHQSDAYSEYLLYDSIIKGEFAGFSTQDLLPTCLTTTWLPAMLQKVTHLPQEPLFRYYAVPLMVWLPVIVYLLVKRYTKPGYAFVASIVFMRQPYMMIAPSVSRIVIATIFASLTILILLSDMAPKKKYVLLPILALLMVVTHYGTALVVALMVLGWLILLCFSNMAFKTQYTIKPVLIYVTALSLASILWYGVVNSYVVAVTSWVWGSIAGEVGLEGLGATPILNNVYVDGGGYEPTAAMILGVNFGSLNFYQQMYVFVIWCSVALMVLGLVTGSKGGKRDEMWWLALVCFALLLGSLFSKTMGYAYGIDRMFFHVSLVLLISAVNGLVWLRNNIVLIRTKML